MPPIKQSKNVVSVKGGCIEKGLDWKKAIHIWTSNAMVPIPEGSECHSEESEFTDYGKTQELLDQPSGLTCTGLSRSVGSDGDQETKPVVGMCELSNLSTSS